MTIQKLSIELQNAVVTDGTTITGDGTAESPLTAHLSGAGDGAGVTVADAAPAAPTLGQQWYDTGRDLLLTCTSVAPVAWRDALGADRTPVAPGSAFRYYRLLITATNGAADRTGVGELVLREAVGGPNLALNQPVTASSDPFGWAPQAVDGSNAGDNGWIASAESLPVWLQVDLGVETPVREYVVYGYGYSGAGDTRSPRDWQLQGSHDGAAWTTLHTVAGQGGWHPNVSHSQSVVSTL